MGKHVKIHKLDGVAPLDEPAHSNLSIATTSEAIMWLFTSFVEVRKIKERIRYIWGPPVFFVPKRRELRLSKSDHVKQELSL